MITRFISLFLSLFLGLSFLVAEQGSARAQSPVASVPQFMPIGSWRVQPTGLANIRGLSNIKLPCMMMTSYDNGFIVRLSGGDQKLLAMAIDFRQSVFHQGRKYPAVINVDGSYTQQVSATAFSESTLIFNLRKLPRFYQVLQNATDMKLEIEGNSMQFTMGGLNHAFERLEGCYNGDTKPSSGIKQAAMVPDTLSNIDMWKEEVTPVAAARMKPATRAKSYLWEAKAGDDMKQTLEGWARRAGVEIDWQATQNERVANDVHVSGSFEDAVQNLMAQNAAAMGLEANLMGGNPSGVSSGSPQQLLPSRIGGASQGMAGVGSAKWNAPAGSSLQQVLSVWSKQAGVDLLWEANQGFAVKNTINTNGSYESALQSLLNQFSNDSMRPAAQLNNDPVSGRRVLLVQSTRI